MINKKIIFFIIPIVALVLATLFPHSSKPTLLSPLPDASTNVSHYIATSQEFLDRARFLADSIGQREQTPEEKENIIAVINQALDLANQAIALYPQDHRSFSQRASIYEALIPFLPDSAKFAINDLKTAISLENNNFHYHQRLAQLYLSLGDYEKATLSFENSLSLNPSDVQTAYNLALLEKRKQKPAEVEEIASTQELPIKEAAAHNQVIIAQDLPAGRQGLPAEVSAEISLNAKTGQGVIPAGEIEVTIYNQNVAEDKLIMIVPKTDTQNKVVYLKAKQGSAWFKAGIDSPTEIDIVFNWWIVD